MKRGALAGATLALLVCLQPTAEAAASTGRFAVPGDMIFPDDTAIRFSPVALLENDTSRLDHLTLLSPRVVVHSFEARAMGLPGTLVVEPPLVREERSWSLTNVELSLSPGGIHSGHLGLDVEHGDATLRAAGRATLTAEETAQLTTGEIVAERDPRTPQYYRRVDEPNLHILAPGELAFSGAAGIKIVGADVVLSSAENRTTIETGGGQPNAWEFDTRWLYIEFTDGILTLHSGETRIEAIATGPTSVAWDGEAILTPRTGLLETSTATYTPDSVSSIIIDGTFNAEATPLRGGLADLPLTGDLRSTTLAAVHTPAPIGATGFNILPYVVLGTVGAGVAVSVGVLVGRRNRVGAGRLIDLAHEADGDERWGAAIAYVRTLREIYPRDARLAHWQARLQACAGDVQPAFGTFEEAVLLAKDGDAAFEAAVLACKHGEAELGLRFALNAIERDPGLAAEIADDARKPDDPFYVIRHRVELQEALRRAL